MFYKHTVYTHRVYLVRVSNYKRFAENCQSDFRTKNKKGKKLRYYATRRDIILTYIINTRKFSTYTTI